MNQLKELMQQLIRTFTYPVPEAYRPDYGERFRLENMHRLRWVLIAMIAWALIMLLSDIRVSTQWDKYPQYRYFFRIDLSVFMIGLGLFLLHGRLMRQNADTQVTVHQTFVFSCAVFILSFSAVISGIEYQATRGAPTYIIAVFLIGTLFEFSGIHITVAYTISTAMLLWTVWIFSQDLLHFVYQNMSLFGLVFIGWFNARVLSLQRRRLFVERKRLADMNTALAREVEDRKLAQTALQQANAVLDSRVQERTAALNQKNTDLEQMVQEKEVLLQEVYHRVKKNFRL
ncbi:hypothetical protein JW948_12335 [bacterium]|nr:hypothetical protein [bacterium]